MDRTAWLITGCSTGIGRAIARAALEAGHHVAVTARDPASVRDLAAEFSETARALALDVTDPEQVRATVAAAEQAFGGLDVVVNNAGYGYVGAVEEGEDAEIRRMFETNFFGVLEVLKAVLPGMRARRSGYVVNISSTTGFSANPGTIYYSTSKFALESLSEGLAKELAPLGIHVTVAGVGTFRTDWSGRSMRRSRIRIDDYADTVGSRIEVIRSVDGQQRGDPARLGEVIVRLAALDEPPPRIVLGRDAYETYRQKITELTDLLDEWEELGRDLDFRD